MRLHLPGAVVFRHEDHFTAGVPDISITNAGHTTWIEVKIARNGKIRSKGIQKLTAQKLAMAGAKTLFVIFEDDGTATYICHPSRIETWHIEARYDGLNYEAVTKIVRGEMDIEGSGGRTCRS